MKKKELCSGCEKHRPHVEKCLADDCKNSLCDYCILNESGILGICYNCSLTDYTNRQLLSQKTKGLKITLRCVVFLLNYFGSLLLHVFLVKYLSACKYFL